MIDSHCPKCNALNEIPEAYLGREVTCPSCKGDYVADRQLGTANRPVPATVPLVRPTHSQTTKEPNQAASNYNKLNFSIGLLALILISFIYVNRSAILPTSKEEGDVAMPPAMDVRPVVQIWEYKVERYRHALQSDKSDNIVLRSYDDAEEATAVFIEESELDEHGRDGWELVSTYLEMETAFYNFGKSDLHTGIKENVRPQAVVAIFKRPKR